MSQRSDFEGLEFDWFATDPEGYVALISSAGFGPIPDSVFDRVAGQRQIEQHLSLLIGMDTSQDLRQVERHLSAEGVYCYDWKIPTGPYQRFAVPSHPRHIIELGIGENLQKSFIRLSHLFRDSKDLTAAMIQ